MLRKNQGYVIRHIKTGDRGKIIYFLSPNLGRIAIYVPNAYKSANSISLNMFNMCQVTYYEKNMPILKEVTIKKELIVNNLNTQMFLLYISMILSKIIPERNPVNNIYTIVDKLTDIIYKNHAISYSQILVVLNLFLDTVIQEIGYEGSLPANLKYHEKHQIVETLSGHKLWKYKLLKEY